MNSDYEISRRYIQDLEFIRCEMELKIHQAKLKNKDFDSKIAENKIALISEIQNYVYTEYEKMESLKKENAKLSLLNSKLLAELSILKNK